MERNIREHNMIEVKNLTKFYGDHKAVDNLTFSIKDGTVCGFLGPNGAGKSTTMNIMTGCLSATSGSVSISGHDIFENPIEAKMTIGYLPEQPPLYTEETPREYLRFVAEAKRIPKDDVKEEIERVMEETQIIDVADRLIKNLSKGVKVDVLEGVVTVSLALNLKYNYNIMDVTGKVQEKVKNAVENMTGLEVADVNIKVAGVEMEKQD